MVTVALFIRMTFIIIFLRKKVCWRKKEFPEALIATQRLLDYLSHFFISTHHLVPCLLILIGRQGKLTVCSQERV